MAHNFQPPLAQDHQNPLLLELTLPSSGSRALPTLLPCSQWHMLPLLLIPALKTKDFL